MNPAWVFAVGGVVSYLAGAVPFGWLIARARGVDLRNTGSGNIGATNVLRSVGKLWGGLTFALDFLKGLLPAWGLPALAERTLGVAGDARAGLAFACAIMSIAGHNWPVYLGFRGGKGVATSAGAFTALAPAAVLIGLAAWLAVMFAFRYVSLASMVASAVAAAASWRLYGGEGSWRPRALTALAVLILWRHRGNVRRLLRGGEHRFGSAKPGAGTAAGETPGGETEGSAR